MLRIHKTIYFSFYAFCKAFGKIPKVKYIAVTIVNVIKKLIVNLWLSCFKKKNVPAIDIVINAVTAIAPFAGSKTSFMDIMNMLLLIKAISINKSVSDRYSDIAEAAILLFSVFIVFPLLSC